MFDYEIINSDSRCMSSYIDKNSIDLIVTSPPYPMISMWDIQFKEFGVATFKDMHKFLNKVWLDCYVVLKPGGTLCINIGDAVRKVDDFNYYPSHSLISEYCNVIGFRELPSIIWKKKANSPNSFLGSGMLPVNAYVTLEHEFILIFRKGSNRTFSNEEMELRRESCYFWEERNLWFRDIWDDVKGVSQSVLNYHRNRNGSFPFELPYRLINMFSIKGDIVLDPFLGFGTTITAAVASGRKCIGIEIEKDIIANYKVDIDFVNTYIKDRISNHRNFVVNDRGDYNYYNDFHNCLVKTKDEQFIKIKELSNEKS